jgi:hypothetical protein
LLKWVKKCQGPSRDWMVADAFFIIKNYKQGILIFDEEILP